MDVLLEPPLIRQHEACATRCGCLRDRPRDRALVGHADNEAGLPGEIGHSGLLTAAFAAGPTVLAARVATAVAMGGRLAGTVALAMLTLAV